LPLIDNIETDPVAWDRIERGLPILCAGDGLGLWVSTHRDDVGKLFTHAAMNPKTFGQSYNATSDQILTWRDYLKQIGTAIGKLVKVIFVPAGWIIAHDRNRFKLLEEITQFHGAYDSSKARRDVPEFRCEIDLKDGAAQTLSYIRRQGIWKESADDAIYESMVQQALAAKIEPVTL
jgi:nucleoside-diphosphate-sugar epimerase